MKRLGGNSAGSPHPPEPKTPEEWQVAVDAAAGARAIADCMMYGLLKGGPVINVGRCDDILERGAALGIKPSRQAVDLAVSIVEEINDEASLGKKV